MTSSVRFPVLAILAACALPGCTDHASVAKVQDLEVEIEQLTKLNSESEQATVRLQAQIEAARQEKDAVKAEKAKLEQDRAAASKELDELKTEFENYKVRYKLSMRKRAPGLHVDDFSIDGTTFSQVTLKELTDTYINFSHNAGVAKLSVKLLPEPLQDLLGINISQSTLSDGHRVTITDPKQVNASLMNEHNLQVIKMEAERTSLVNKLAATRREMSDTRQQLNYASNKGSPVGALKKKISEQLDTIAKLEGLLAQAGINQYQVQRDLPKLLPAQR